MADNIIQIEVEIEGKKGFATLNKDALAAGESAAKGVADGFATSFSKFTAPIKAAVASLGAIIGAGLFTKEAIEASAEQAKAVHELSIALANAGRFSEDAKNRFIAFADEMQRTTTLQDDFVIGLQKTATNFAKTNDEALKLTEAAIQLSAATGMDANDAVQKLGLSLTGVSRGLNLAIPGFTKTSEEALKAGAAVEFVLEKFNGTAQAQVNTFSGAILQAKNKFNELLESIGDIVTKSPEVVALIKVIGDSFLSAAKSIGTFAQGGGLKTVILGLLDFALVITDTVLPVIETLKNAFNLFVQFTAGAIQEYLIIPLLSLAETAVTVGNAVGLTSDQTAQSFTTMKEAAISALDEINANTYNAANATEEFPLTLKIREMITELQNAAVNAPALTEQLKNGVGANLDALAMKGKITADALNKAFNGALAGGISSGVQSLTRALIAGQNAFQAFGQAILGIIGDMAIQLGTFFIAQGIAQLALASNPLTAGGAIVAAGVGLVALGTLLKALSGGSGATSGAGATAGSGSYDAGVGVTSQPSEVTDQQEVQKPQTQVAVNIQGNVLDRRETGLEIVNVLNEFFDTNNGVIART